MTIAIRILAPNPRRGWASAYALHWAKFAPTRVLACADCGQTRPWQGFTRALLAGWTWTFRRGFRWTCPDCGGAS